MCPAPMKPMAAVAGPAAAVAMPRTMLAFTRENQTSTPVLKGAHPKKTFDSSFGANGAMRATVK